MRILDSLKSWKLWTALIVVVAAGAGGYYGYSQWSDSGTEEEAGQTQLVPITLGNLVNDVSVPGTITYTTRETLTFGQQGFVSDVSVSEGDAVSAGDALAALDTETVANLERAIAQARNDVRDAEDALEEARNPYTAVQIAQAEADVANARQNLRKAEEELSELGIVSPSDLAQARMDVLNAQADLDTARETRAGLNAPTFQELAKARADVTDARVALQDAEDALDALLDPIDDEVADEIAGYESDIESAEENLASARFDLQTAERNAEEKVQDALDELNTAREDYNALFQKWLGMDVSQESGQSPDDILAAHGIALESVFMRPQIQSLRSNLGLVVPADDPATPWDEVVVFSWVILYPGQFQVDCGDSNSGADLMCIRDEFEDAFDSIQERESNLETIQGDEAEKIRKAEVAVSNAEETLVLKRDALEDYLADVNAEPDQLLVESSERAIETAQADLFDAESALADLAQVAESDIQLADQEIELAEARLAEAEESLADLLADPDPVDTTVKQTAVGLARESLAEAEATLQDYSAVDQLEIELRQAELVASRATLETAIADLERATLRAPFDGIVVAVNIEPDQQVNANTQAIEIADPSIVEVSGSVDEIDVLFLQVGAQAYVTLEALANQALPGTVSSIASIGSSQQGVVTYPVTIRVDSSEIGQVPEGLSATAQVIIRERNDVPLIPLQALYGTVQSPTVRVVSGNDIIEREVSLGISDDFWIVVEDGLEEGETISMEVVGSGTSQFGGIGATFRAVGGFSGPRGGGPGGGSR